MKKFAVVLCVFALVAGTAFAGGSQEIVDDGGLHGSLTVATNASSPTFEAVEHIIELFMEENPGVEVEYTAMEAIMRI